jgi:hypothetical protein
LSNDCAGRIQRRDRRRRDGYENGDAHREIDQRKPVAPLKLMISFHSFVLVSDPLAVPTSAEVFADDDLLYR